MKNDKKIAIYVRVSTEEQVKKNLSIPNQIRLLEDYCNLKGWSSYKVYRDEGLSGSLSYMDRPGLNSLVEDIKDGGIGIVLVYNIDRLGRHENLFEFYDFLYKSGVSVADTSTIYNYDDINKKLHRNLETVIAIYNRDVIRKRSLDGKREAVRQNRLLISYPSPYGYKKSKQKGKLEIVEVEADIIKKIFDFYTRTIDRLGCDKIANYLNENKYPTQHLKQNRKASAKFWRASRVGKIIRNRIYTGKFTHFRDGKNNKPMDVDIPHIIDEFTFNKARKIADENYAYAKRNGLRKYKYKSLLYCKDCKSKLHGEFDYDKQLKYYLCNGRKRVGCLSGRVYEYELDNTVWTFIKNRILEPKTLEEDIKEIIKSGDNYIDCNSEMERLEGELLRYRNKKSKIIDLYEDDLIEKEDYSARYQTIISTIEDIENKIVDLGKQHELNDKRNMEKIDFSILLKRFKEYVEDEIDEDKATEINRLFIDGVEIDSIRDPNHGRKYLKHKAKAFFKFTTTPYDGLKTDTSYCGTAWKSHK